MCVKILSIEKKKKNARSSSVHTLQVMSQLPKLFLKTQLEILKVFCPIWKAPFDLKDIFFEKHVRKVHKKSDFESKESFSPSLNSYVTACDPCTYTYRYQNFQT